jgi:hypothetical protein
MDLKPSCPVLQHFLQDRKIAGLSERMQESYCRALRKFATYLGYTDDFATEEQVRNDFIHIVDQRMLSASTLSRYATRHSMYFELPLAIIVLPR